jgi:hypothetical protein
MNGRQVLTRDRASHAEGADGETVRFADDGGNE